MLPTRRALLRGAAAAGAVGLAGCTGLFGGGGGGTDTPRQSVAGAPLPNDPTSFTYERMGNGGGGTPAVTYFGNWKCPFCANFATGTGDREMFSLPRILGEYVSPGDIDLQYRALAYKDDGKPFLGPDAPRAARAGIALWNVEPSSYWPYHEEIMGRQPPESEQWATVERLVGFAQSAGVDAVDEFRSAIEAGKHEEAVRATTNAAVEAGVKGTPALAYDGRVVDPSKPDQTKSLLDSAANRG